MMRRLLIECLDFPGLYALQSATDLQQPVVEAITVAIAAKNWSPTKIASGDWAWF
jgi:hypothetical protein